MMAVSQKKDPDLVSVNTSVLLNPYNAHFGNQFASYSA